MPTRTRFASVRIGGPAVARRRPGRSAALAAVTLAAGLAVGLLATSAGAQTPPQPNAKVFQKYRTCLAKHGVKLPKNGGFPGGGGPGGSFPSGTTPGGAVPGGGTPPSGPPGGNGGTPRPSLPKGVSQKKFDRAQKACRSKLPNGGRGGGPGGGSEAFQAYLSCLRDHGVNVPEPGKNGSNRPPSFDPNDPTFAAANQTCGVLAPNGGVTTTTQATT
jgi:hypothetical protein